MQGAARIPRQPHRVPRRQQGPRFQIETDAAKPKSREPCENGLVKNEAPKVELQQTDAVQPEYDGTNRPLLSECFRIRGNMRKNLLAASCGIIFLLGVDHVSAGHVSSPLLKLCQAADGNAAGTSTADAPIEPADSGTQKAQVKPARSAEDVALSERLQDLIANRLQQYVARPQDRTAVEAFYRERDFAHFG